MLRVNHKQRQRMVDKIVRAVGSPRGKLLGVLGLTFKPNTDDIREAPALEIIKKLQALGARIQAFDPAGMKEARKLLKRVDFKNDAYEVGQGADALILITEWNQFRNIDWPRMKELLKQPIVIDLRNVYDPARMQRQGIQYYGVGRPALE